MSVSNFESDSVHADLEHNGSNVLCAIVKTCIGEDKINMWEEWMIVNESTFVEAREKDKDVHKEYSLEWTKLHEEFESLVNRQLTEAVTGLGVDMEIFEGLLKKGAEADDDEDDADSLFKQINVFVNFINSATNFQGFVDIMSDKEKRAYYFGVLGGWRSTLK